MEDCGPEVLKYEWVWTMEHSEGLELCLSQQAMLEQIGG